ncbi:biotin--[acetyl-CoA-carboxylase] ligase [Primorskyibacter flagellatus]|uniref:biotin--[acetyl-CoA-carboxylase] ligase n=1 Tax=Primorskyibacter flagellatus TaxID=1387277 RepID=UPI003A917D2E
MSWPAGYGRRILPELDSTNAEAVRIAATLAGPEWICALRQTAGKGRRGRAWSDPQGNLAATLVLRVDDAPDVTALRSFVAALALFDAFVVLTGRVAPFSLKWPNDVLLNGGKVAGILLESFEVGGVRHLAIGTGVNLRNAPEAAQVEAHALRPVSLQGETGLDVAPEIFLDALATSYAELEEQFVTHGFAPIRRAWLDRAARLGETITARTGTTETTGVFETVDQAGNLVLTTSQGRVAIPAADVFFKES